jgi:ribonuclease P protein component
VRRTGIRRRVGDITVFAATGGSDGPRLAFIASRAVGSAVHRNRAKRRLREAAARVPLRASRDYVVIASRAVTEAPFEDLVAWLARAVTEEE